MNLKKLIGSDNQRTAAVKKNILASLLIKGVSIVVSLMLVPMTLGYVSSEMYGIWLTLSSVMMWLYFFDIGFTPGLKNKLAEAIARGDWERGRCLVSSTYFMMLVIFVPLCLIGEALVPLVNWARFLNVSPEFNEEITRTMYALVAFFCLQMIVNVLTAVVAAFQKVALSSLFFVLGNILSLIVIWLLPKFCAPSLLSLAFAFSAMPILVLLIASIVFFNGRFKRVAPSFRAIRLSQIKDIFTLGARFFLIQIQVLVLYQSTNILISNVSSAEYVTSYNIAYRYLNVGVMVYLIMLDPLWPAFTDAYTKSDFGWMNGVYRKMSKMYALSALAMILMAAVSPLAYYLWIGDKAEVPWTLTLSVLAYMLLNNWDRLQVNLINGIGTVQLQTYVTIFGLVAHIPLSLFLGRTLGLGAVGVVLSMIVVNVVYSTFFTLQINLILKKKAKGIWLK